MTLPCFIQLVKFEADETVPEELDMGGVAWRNVTTEDNLLELGLSGLGIVNVTIFGTEDVPDYLAEADHLPPPTSKTDSDASLRRP